jgi:hypothetical protein
MNILTFNSDGTGITLLAVGFHFDGAGTERKVIWQPESDLCKT